MEEELTLNRFKELSSQPRPDWYKDLEEADGDTEQHLPTPQPPSTPQLSDQHYWSTRGPEFNPWGRFVEPGGTEEDAKRRYAQWLEGQKTSHPDTYDFHIEFYGSAELMDVPPSEENAY